MTCLTGRVKVSSNKESVILEPASFAELEKGKIVVQKNCNTENIISWKNNRFFFPGTPLHEVIDEIERQYGVTIKVQESLNNKNFAGNFPRKLDVEEVLGDVCKVMGVKYIKQSENIFLIVANS